MMFRSSIDVVEGGIRQAISQLSSQETPDLLIVETDSTGDEMFEELGALADVCSPNTRLVLIGVQNDILLFKELIGQGISEYMIAPVSSEMLSETIATIFADEDTSNTNRMIAVTGVRGGTGSSIIAHNLAWEIANAYNEDVTLVDLDITGGTAALNFNIQPKQTIADALGQTARLDAVIVERFMVECGKNVSLLAAPASLESGVQVTADNLDVVLRILRRMSNFLVLDIPYLWTLWTREVLLDADETVLVALPDLICMRDTKNYIDFLGPKRGVDAPVRLVLNKVGENKKTEISLKDFRESTGAEPVVSIPYDPATFGAAITNGEMLSDVAAKSKATEALRQLTERVGGKVVESEKKSGGLLSLFKSK
ncbi:MAG: AAA family ATPase [Magnetospiraceae bacterium]